MSETPNDRSKFSVGNIGSVGGDVFSGTKIEGRNIAHTENGDANVEVENDSKLVKYMGAVAGLLSALALVITTVLELLNVTNFFGQ
jgi:hypothetical protein